MEGMTPAIGGLCHDCPNEAGCTFPREPGRPVWQCEEFTSEEPIPAGHSCEGTAAARTGLTADAKIGETLAGLCTNCDNRKGCSFPRPECGVWHCEEYK